jgi:hypothetical protein
MLHGSRVRPVSLALSAGLGADVADTRQSPLAAVISGTWDTARDVL